MSHFVKVDVEIREEAMLLAALESLGYIVQHGGEIAGWENQRLPVALACHPPGFQYPVGFVRPAPDEPLSMVADWMGAPMPEQHFGQQLLRAYSEQVAIRNAKRDGWGNLIRTVQPDGTIILELERGA